MPRSRASIAPVTVITCPAFARDGPAAPTRPGSASATVEAATAWRNSLRRIRRPLSGRRRRSYRARLVAAETKQRGPGRPGHSFWRDGARLHHRQLQPLLLRALPGDVVTRIGMAHHAGARVVPQHARQALVGLLAAV